jgi:hypothetical protein
MYQLFQGDIEFWLENKMIRFATFDLPNYFCKKSRSACICYIYLILHIIWAPHWNGYTYPSIFLKSNIYTKVILSVLELYSGAHAGSSTKLSIIERWLYVLLLSFLGSGCLASKRWWVIALCATVTFRHIPSFHLAGAWGLSCFRTWCTCACYPMDQEINPESSSCSTSTSILVRANPNRLHEPIHKQQ